MSATRRDEIQAIAARTLEHCPYHPNPWIDVTSGATSLTQALILAAGGMVGAGPAAAQEPAEDGARDNLHRAVRALLAKVGLAVAPDSCPCQTLARWEQAAGDPATIYRLVGAHPAASHHLRVFVAA